MRKPPKRRKLGRVCAVCRKRGGTTYGFKTALRMLGLPNWRDDKAHVKCVQALRLAETLAPRCRQLLERKEPS